MKPERVTPLAQVESSIRQQLLDEKRNEVLQEWLDGLEKEYEAKTVYAAGFEPPKTETGTTTAPAPPAPPATPPPTQPATTTGE